jgi:hypothetical protein
LPRKHTKSSREIFKLKSLRGKFVIQEHTKSNQPPHWDLMLETGDVLQTWRLDTEPKKEEYLTSAIRISDHDKKFLTYEGPVNKGLGSIHILDTGTFETLEEAENRILLSLKGNILCGTFAFRHSERDLWVFSIFNTQ